MYIKTERLLISTLSHLLVIKWKRVKPQRYRIHRICWYKFDGKNIEIFSRLEFDSIINYKHEFHPGYNVDLVDLTEQVPKENKNPPTIDICPKTVIAFIFRN